MGFGIIKKPKTVEIIHQEKEHVIYNKFNGFLTGNGNMEIELITIVSIVIKKKGNDTWWEWCIEQPDVLIKDPFYDCEYTTNRILKSLLACDLMRAKEWIADNYNYYDRMAQQCNNRLIKPWE